MNVEKNAINLERAWKERGTNMESTWNEHHGINVERTWNGRGTNNCKNSEIGQPLSKVHAI